MKVDLTTMRNIKRAVLALFLGAFILCGTTPSFGQMTQVIKNKVEGPAGYEEIFHVLHSSRVKEGVYERYDANSHLDITGSYSNNVETGDWKFYSHGELEYIFDYTSKELKFSKFNGDLDTIPSYGGSLKKLYKDLSHVLRYPLPAKRMGTEGTVLASILVNENNTVEEIQIIRGPTTFISDTIQGLTKLENKWIAGVKNGKKVKSEMLVLVIFKLSE